VRRKADERGLIAWVFVALTAATSASASPTASGSPSATPVTPPPTLPAGHPRVEPSQPNRSPHGQPGTPAFFRPPADTTDEEAGVTPGTIVVELRDAANNVVAHHAVELGILQQSVAKGESRKHVPGTTGDDGRVTFDSLERSASVAYRVTAHEGEATFAARPFQLNHDRGAHVVLHVYPATSDYTQTAMIISRSVMYLEMKDDRVQIQQRIDVFNGSPVAWVPHELIIKLPPDFTALSSMQQMSDIGVDSVDKQGARLHGTFLPGENAVLFNWQLPYSGTSEVSIDVGMPPNLGQLVVRAAASPGMKLTVPGFRDAVSQVNEEGLRELVTGRQLQEGEVPLRKVHIELTELPTPGPARWIATAFAFVGLAAGIVAVRRRPANTKASAKRTQHQERARLLELIESLEDAHARGDVGPKTYERARRELIDELASLLASRS
jgi:hypothetical protein